MCSIWRNLCYAPMETNKTTLDNYDIYHFITNTDSLHSCIISNYLRRSDGIFFLVDGPDYLWM